jgi:hypothetical protein
MGLARQIASRVQAATAGAVWTLSKNGKRIDAELMFHAEYGVEIQFLHERVMAYGRWISTAPKYG